MMASRLKESTVQYILFRKIQKNAPPFRCGADGNTILEAVEAARSYVAAMNFDEFVDDPHARSTQWSAD
jgi:hypothetical protein